MTPELGAAFSGLGLVMEFVAHEVKRRAAPECEVSVELGAIETGRGPHGREMISVNITEYADPLCPRSMRAPFSVYLKPEQQRFGIGDGVVDGLLPLIVVPIGELSVAEALAVRQRRLKHVAHSLDQIAAHCRRLGLTCVLENKLPHLLFGNTADMLWILGAMTVTDVGVCLDTGHAHLAGEIDTAIQKLTRHLRMVHASDNAGSASVTAANRSLPCWRQIQPITLRFEPRSGCQL